MRTLISIAVLAIAACAHESPAIVEQPVTRDRDVPPPLERVPSTEFDARACARLRALACPEGVEAACRRTFANARTLESRGNEGDVDVVATCVTVAPGVAEVRRCGGPSTLTFDCPGR